MQIGRIFGVKIVFNWLFFFFLFFYALMGRLAESVTLFTVVLLHDFFHLLVARGYGLRVKEVELFPFGGMAHIDDLLEYDPMVESRVALAGPLFNIFMVGAAIIVYTNSHILAQELLLFFIRCNLLIASFNLLPLLPLDGGRVLRANLSKRFGYRKATEQAVLISKIMAVIFFTVGILGFYYGAVNYSLLLIAPFIYYAAHREQNQAAYVFVRYLNRKHRELDREGILKAGYIVALEDTPLKEIIKQFTHKNYQMVLVISPGYKIKGTVTEGQIIDAVFKRGSHLPIKNLL
ncbi:M50 family metallopeptidase [Candidatus Contubernalis alkaliaceticus]|uniref:M50 family metallopeptidase n=1 Tax=Candidatus Contubernalis alkaliaceticus TaxID=338645 RepID=UPI001F4C1A9E|nr:M50 family metallopeptidase [Candidatus Contubernalis alkalaceticus]UNC90925.1 site-2 protease family protein [Candidatus Contubernalis alkalaceticus]